MRRQFILLSTETSEGENSCQSVRISDYNSTLFCFSIPFYEISFYSALFSSVLFCSMLVLSNSIAFYAIPFYSSIFYSDLLRSIPFYCILWQPHSDVSSSVLSYAVLFYSAYSILFESILFFYCHPFSSLLFYSAVLILICPYCHYGKMPKRAVTEGR